MFSVFLRLSLRGAKRRSNLILSMSQIYYVYIMTNYKTTVLYVGVTNNIWARMHEHKQKQSPLSFTARYSINKLVYYEEFDDINQAIDREKQLKGGSRSQKVSLIVSHNPSFEDLAADWF